MRIIVFGSTGFIGKNLCEALQKKGHEVVSLDQRRSKNWQGEISRADAVINLAGAPVVGKRWNPDTKAEIFDSRVEGTKKIVAVIHKNYSETQKPKVFINASAIGIYGSSPNETFNEESAPGSGDFLSFVCREWEEAAKGLQALPGLRLVLLRTGVVLGKDGGALQKMLLPFKLGLGGKIGDGKQWMSWIHLEDEIGLILWALENDKVHGPLDLASPNPVTNQEYTQVLGKILHRPTLLPVPKLGLHVLFGEGAEVLTASQKVIPQKAIDLGYQFKYPRLEDALRASI